MGIESVKYWFHGTDINSARDICTKGISVDQGRTKLDFSDGSGFYVTSSITQANEWSQITQRYKKFGTAIVVFKLKNSAEMFSKQRGETLSGDDWKNAVQFFRCGKNRKNENGIMVITKQRASQLLKYDWLFGPIAKDGGLRFNPKRINPRSPEDGVNYQLCIKTSGAAETFYNEGHNIERVIFFRKNSEA